MSGPKWYVMRTLRRPNARERAHETLTRRGFEVFVPMRQRLVERGGRRRKEMVPALSDLLFVHSEEAPLQAEVELDHTLQFRWLRGTYREPMTVAEAEMNAFIRASQAALKPRFLLPEELSERMIGRRVRIVGGPLQGAEGHLLRVQGARSKRLVVSLEGLVAVSAEVTDDLIEVIGE